MDYFEDGSLGFEPYEADDYSYDYQLVELMSAAAKYSMAFGEELISSASIILAAIANGASNFSDYLETNYIRLTANSIFKKIVGDAELYEKVTGLDYSKYPEKKNRKIGIAIDSTEEMEYTEIVLNALRSAVEICDKLNVNVITADMVIYACLKDKTSEANTLISIFVDDAEKIIKDYLAAQDEAFIVPEKDAEEKPKEEEFKIPKSFEPYITDLNTKYKPEDGCDILGRDDIMKDIWLTLCKMQKRNVILVGPPGAGKSAIMEALAYSIVSGKCPPKFSGYHVLSLCLNNMVAGTKYRGEFEEKVQDLLSYLEKTTNVIVFIDEIHQMLGAGGTSESGIDFSTSLKPALARDVIFIGSTTPEEYEILAQDKALCRRFRNIEVKEPKIGEVAAMIKKRVETLTAYHSGVKVSDRMLKRVIMYSSAFSNISNPDRTLDLLDMALGVAEKYGAKCLTDKHIVEVYASYFKIYDKMSKDNKWTTAVHEAGHFVAWYYNREKMNDECVLVSIVPAYHWLGVNIFEEKEVRESPYDLKYLEREVVIDLAGRYAEVIICNSAMNSGARSDLSHAADDIENYLLKFGIEEENYSYDTSMTQVFGLSETRENTIRVKTKELLDNFTTKTQMFIESHRADIEAVARLLMEKGVITSDEAGKVINSK